MFERFFTWQHDNRAAALAIVIVITGVLGGFASQVRPDYSVEHFFPVWNDARQEYDRFKAAFPYEDTQALVIVEAPDIYTPEGLRRIAALEADLAAISDVRDVDGLLSVDDIIGRDGELIIEKLFAGPDLSPDEIARQRAIATTDPLFAWNLAQPDGSSVTIRIVLSPDAVGSVQRAEPEGGVAEAPPDGVEGFAPAVADRAADRGGDAGRQKFLHEARAVLAKHEHPGQRLVLSGLPAIRARFAELIGQESSRYLPLAMLVVLALLFVAYRSVGAVLAGFVTILLAIIWSHGVMGMLGYSVTMLQSVLPVTVTIISLSDTVHIVNDFFALRRDGKGRREALIDAMASAAGPCLATEVVLACGFLSLIAVNIVAILEFGITTACAMLLTWLANVLVLPLLLSLVKSDGRTRRSGDATGAAAAPAPVRAFASLIEWIAHVVTKRPARVIAVVLVIVATGGWLASRVERISYVFDDLRKDSDFYQELRIAEKHRGGLVPIAIFVESLAPEGAENPILEPEVVRLADRAAAFLERFDEIKQASSVADHLRKAQAALLPEEVGQGDGLPDNRPLVAQEVLLIDDGDMLRDHLAFDRRSVAALGWARDVGSRRVHDMFVEIDAFVAAEQARMDADADGPRVHVSATGQLRLFDEVNRTLIEGLAGSFAGAVGVTLIVFCIVLRSWRLGLIGLVPNISPMVLVFAFMTVMGITLRPSIVVVFSIILVIADDDTIQYLARLRTHYARVRKEKGPGADLHNEAALSCMRETGLPMFITSTSVAGGFSLLLLSAFQGIADIGLLIGVTLFAAVFADLFISPILIRKFRPPLD